MLWDQGLNPDSRVGDDGANVLVVQIMKVSVDEVGLAQEGVHVWVICMYSQTQSNPLLRGCLAEGSLDQMLR